MSRKKGSYNLSEKVLVKKIDDKYVFLPKEDFEVKHLYTTNEVGYQILGFLLKGLSVDKIVNELHLYYEIDRFTLKKDVEDFITQLLKKGILLKRK